ncbi:antibiotic biosynthesis monooxygenase [Luteimonas sp. B3_2_R+30]|uniref:Antibiotic biosynthesis monooxygenase n=1 Tax=Luteimonas salinilitoris TaxID=3237697 RepID=A0ABV4HS25_9GAMM
MIVVIFEVEPYPTGRDEYFSIAAALTADLQQVDGFISIERYQSVSDPGRLLSLSLWRDEAAIATWRRHPPHVAAQQRGSSELFRRWRIRVAAVLREREHDAVPACASTRTSTKATGHRPTTTR